MPRIIGPDEVLTLEATLDATFMPGEYSQPFHVAVKGFRRRLPVSVTRNDVMPFPSRVDLGPFDRSIEKVIEMHELARSAGLELVASRCADQRVRLATRDSHRLEIAVGPLDVAERVETFCDLGIGGGKDLSHQRIWVRGMASAGLVVEPADLPFGLMRVDGAPVTKESRVRAADAQSFELVPQVTEHPLPVTLDVRQVSPLETKVAVTVHPRHRGALDLPLKLTTPDGLRGVTVRCVATIE